MADEENQLEATLPDMNLDDAEATRPPSEGWHPAMLVDVTTKYKKDDMELPEQYRRRNYVLKPELSEDDPEMPGYKNLGSIYIPIPTPVEIEYHKKFAAEKSKEAKKQMMLDNPEMHTKDGRTKCSQKMDWIKKAAACFGGKESGKFDKNFFTKQIGQKFQVNLEHDVSQGDIQARVTFMGIRPA